MSNCSKRKGRSCVGMIQKGDTICDICDKSYRQCRAEAIDECKNIVIQTLDNEGLADTLLLRMENLKGEK